MITSQILKFTHSWKIQKSKYLSSNIDEVIRSVYFFMIKFHKHKKEYKALKSTTNLRFVNLKLIDIRFIDFEFMDIRFVKPKKHLSGKE